MSRRRIGIGVRLTAGFTLVVVLLAALALYAVWVSQEALQASVGRGSVFLADEMLKGIDHNLYFRLEELQKYTQDLTLQKVVAGSNREFDQLKDAQAYITEKDQAWTAAPVQTVTPFMQALLNNELSAELNAVFIKMYEKKYGYAIFDEILVTNKYGANVAQTGKTSDYRQDDEEWWQKAQEQDFYVSNMEYDESTGTYGISMAVSIDDDGGNRLGVIKAVVPVGGIAREAEFAARKYETAEIELLTQDGRRIYATKPFRFLEDISDKTFFKRIEAESGFFVVEEAGREKLFAYTSSRGYREFAGLPWVLVVDYDVEEVLKPIFGLRNNILIASAVLIIISIVIALSVSRSIARPIVKFRHAAEDIARGQLGIQIDPQLLAVNNEIGDLARSFTTMAQSLAQRQQEVTERTRQLEVSQEALRESEEKIRKIFLSSPDAIIVSDLTGHITACNQAALNEFGFTTEKDLIGQNGLDLVAPQDRRQAGKNIQKTLKQGTRGESQYTLITKNGRQFPAEVSSSAILDAKGQPVSFVIIMKDISRRKRAEEELIQYRDHLEELVAARTAELNERVTEIEQLNNAMTKLLADLQTTNRNLERTARKLQVANQELEDFAYVVSHDLKAPLRAITQLADWISADYKETLDKEGQEMLQLLNHRTRRMHNLIEDILQYSRVGRLAEKERKIDLNQLVREVVEMLAPPEHIRVTLENKLPLVVGEPTRLEQVFQNLLANAIKFIDKPEGQIRINCVAQAAGWTFSIADNGPGIEEKYYPKIFQVFQTLAPRDDPESTGIGLALVKKIIEAWGGKIWVESEIGRGSAFFFTFPQKEANNLEKH
ncbi:MAG: PAS domain S-box protein [Anaerolineae bacterium]|nr:PAS domain S-box protein [Anaerolineae bacterium]